MEMHTGKKKNKNKKLTTKKAPVIFKTNKKDETLFKHVKNLPANAGDTRDACSISGQDQPLEKGMATYSSILAWKISWTEEPCEL